MDEAFFDSSSPVLLLGLNKPASKDELLADIPPRPVADRLVSQFLHCREPILVVLHFPTFQKEYNQFWLNPRGVSLQWLGLLYAIFALAVSVLNTIEEPVPHSLGDHQAATTRFRKRTVQCLVQANYITPGRYKVEALFLYTMGEFLTSCDAQAGVSFMLGLTIRLAMRMGYHRDPRNFPKMSAFEGEMRRRLWAVVSQLDTLISFQVGLPRTIQAWQHDSRPETELTPLCYTIAKGRIMSIFGRISDLAYSREPVTYEQTLEIDRHLEEAHNQIPLILRTRPMEQSITDPSDLILRRFTLEILYQKCRCVLHRRYLAEFPDDMRYTYSRWVCMTAAKQILRHQAVLHHESQPGGQLYREKRFPNSIQNTDYLLAAMIICLGLSPGHPREPGTNSQSNDVTVIIKGREDLLLTLETSHQIFKDMRRRSADAQKAYAAMSIMLRCVKKTMQHAADLNGSGGQEFNTTSDGKMTSLWLVQDTKSAGCSFTTPV
ncbi:transcription factor C6 [Aspergillus fumigatus]|nr:transcription factor C6 [Aspergillus fumigatus]